MSLLPVSEALHRLVGPVVALAPEDVALHESGNRFLAAPLLAKRTQPPFNSSAMDGYAIRSADAAVGARLKVVGRSVAGRRFEGSVGDGEAARIFTGAPVPEGADCILLQEDAQAENDWVIVGQTVEVGRHIRDQGLDFRQGDELLPAGRRLDPAALSLAAAGGHGILSVVRAPRVAIIATGDELVLPGMAVGQDQIVASNAYGVAEICRQAGGVPIDMGIVADDRSLLGQAIDKALEQADIIVTLGGASVGDHDIVGEVFLQKGLKLDFWKIAMRPGKPLLAGRLNGVTVLGLPGNPVSSLVCAHLFLRPLIHALQGGHATTRRLAATLEMPMKENDHRQDYVRALIRVDDGGRIFARPLPRQDSSMLSALSQASGLIVRHPMAPAAKVGEQCEVELPFRDITGL